MNLNPSVCDDINISDFKETIIVNCKLNNITLSVGIVYSSSTSSHENSKHILNQKLCIVEQKLVIGGRLTIPRLLGTLRHAVQNLIMTRPNFCLSMQRLVSLSTSIRADPL